MADPMLRWVCINPLTYFWLPSTMFLSWLFTHQLWLVFQLPSLLVVLELGIGISTLFYNLATATPCAEQCICKPTTILYLSFLLCCVVSGACVLGIRTPTPLLYLSSLSCIEALILYSNFFLSCALLDVICIRMHNPIPTVFELSQLSLSSFRYRELGIPTLISFTTELNRIRYSHLSHLFSLVGCSFRHFFSWVDQWHYSSSKCSIWLGCVFYPASIG